MENVVFDPDLSQWLAGQFWRAHEVPLSRALAEHRGVTVQAANHQLRSLERAGVFTSRLVGRRKLYRLGALRRAAKSYERAATEEDAVWRNLIAPCLDRFTQPPAMRVLEYGSTEMINNARDHSEGKGVTVRVGWGDRATMTYRSSLSLGARMATLLERAGAERSTVSTTNPP